MNVGGVFVTIWPATENSFTGALIVSAMIILVPTTMGRYVEGLPMVLANVVFVNARRNMKEKAVNVPPVRQLVGLKIIKFAMATGNVNVEFVNAMRILASSETPAITVHLAITGVKSTKNVSNVGCRKMAETC